MEKKTTFQNSKGSNLAAILTETGNEAPRERNPSEALGAKGDKKFVLVMAHGFMSNKNTTNFVKLTERLTKKGIATFRFDFFGHGDSDGLFKNITVSEAIDDILQAIAFVKSQGFQKVGLLGSSFGGLASILAASKTKDLSFLTLKSPVSDYPAIEKSRYSQAQLDKWERTGYIDYIDNGKHLKLNYSFISDMNNHNAYTAAKKITIPTMIVHGNKDEQVPYSQSQKLVKNLSNGVLVTIDGADHRYTTESHASQMLATITNFVVGNSH